MHIDRLEVKGFGRIKDLCISLYKGVNIVYGANESGKTTLQWFIRGMLYGLDNRRNSRNRMVKPLSRFEPWDKGYYGGSMEYSLDDGSTYKVERNFSTGDVRLYDSSYNDITGQFDIGKDRMPKFAEQHLGINEDTFERTVLIRQMGVKLDSGATSALAGKIVNVNSTGFEDISLSNAEKALVEALRKHVGTSRTVSQPLDKLNARLKQLNEEYDVLKHEQQQMLSKWDQLTVIRDRLRRLEEERKFLRHIGEIIDIRKSLDINLKRESGIKEAILQIKRIEASSGAVSGTGKQLADIGKKASDAFNRADSTVKQSDKRIKKYIASGFFALLALALILFSAILYKRVDEIPSWVLPAVLGACVTAFSAAGVLLSGIFKAYPNEKKVIYENQYDSSLISNILTNTSMICDRQLNSIYDAEKELNKTSARLEELSNKLEQEIYTASIAKCKNEGRFSKDDIEELFFDSSVPALESIWISETEALEKDILDLSLKEKYYEGIVGQNQTDNGQLTRLEEEIVAVKGKISYLKQKGDALKLAHEVLLEAGLEIKREYGPDLDKRMSAIIAGLTDGRYMDLRGNDRLELMVSVPESGDVKSAALLSGAAEDQMYLALRLAMAGLITEGVQTPPIIMDEVFSQFDEYRTELALRYLYDAFSDKQVLLFTCKKREVELANMVCSGNLNYVEL